MLLEGIKQYGGKAEVAFHELFRVLRTIDTCEVEDKVAILAPGVELFRGGVYVVFINFVDDEIAVVLGFTCLYIT